MQLFTRRNLAFLVFVFAQLFLAAGSAQAQQVGADYDHANSGFQISGPHNLVRCETCHINGIFKGTPRDCASCHARANSRSTIFPSANHLPISKPCESCHFPSAARFQDAVYSHVGVAPNSCVSCHGGNYPQIKSAPADTTHTLATANGASCDACHGLGTFGNIRLPAFHIPTVAGCVNCHVSSSYKVMPSIDAIHANAYSTTGNCAQCHSAANAAVYNQIGNGVGMVPPIVAPPAGHVDMGSLSCESCHVGANSGIIATPVVTGMRFTNAAFSHVGLTKTCADCHGSGVSPSTFFGVVPKTNAALSPPHLPTTQSCDTCHAVPTGLVSVSGGFGTNTFANARFTHTGITSGCANCHDSSITGSTFYGVPSIVVMPSSQTPGPNSHLPTSNTCENCHTAPTGYMTTVGTVPGSGFRTPAPLASQIHSGVTGNCASCHEANYTWLGMAAYPIRTAPPYTGFQTRPQHSASGTFFVMDGGHPDTGECSNCHGSFTKFDINALPDNHIPFAAGAQCQACHVTSDYSAMPSLTNIHANAPSSSTNCVQCHSAANAATYNQLAGMQGRLVGPADNHIPMGSLSCESCHTPSLPVTTGKTFAGSYFSHTGITTNCGTCHDQGITVGTFQGAGFAPKTDALSPPHIPVITPMGCESCHVNSIPATPVPASGVTGGGTTFANAKFSHSGVTWSCVTCHGPTITGSSFFGINSIVVMPPSASQGPGSHLPTSTSCQDCHSGSIPSGLVAANAAHAAPGSGFASPAPSRDQIHAGITSGCASCHEANYQWMGVTTATPSPYPITRTAPFTGFQTRPTLAGGAFSVADQTPHPASGDCSNCHGSPSSDFAGPSKPANHIPYVSGAACTVCHTNSDYSQMPALDKIHAYAQTPSSNCAQCHSAANAATYAIPAVSFTIKAPSDSHVPLVGTTACEDCHVGTGSSVATAPPTSPSMSFLGSKYSHSGITTGCVTCHGGSIASNTFANIPAILAVNTTNTTQGASSHIPTGAACESCHVNSVPAGQIALPSGTSVPIVVGTTGFKLLLTTASNAAVHNGVTGSCNTCHEKNFVWLGMSLPSYAPSSTTASVAASYTGFLTRPYGSPSTPFAVNDANHAPNPATSMNTGDCSQCHSSTAAFSSVALPSNHIPFKTGTACAACHTTSSYSTMPALVDIHANAQSTTGNCAQCHSTANAALYATPNLTIKGPTTNGDTHMDMGSLGCESCHTASLPVGNSSSFKNAGFSHTGLAVSCATCHSTVGGSAITFSASGQTPSTPKSTAGLSPGHVPTALGCEKCHSTPTALIPFGSTTTTFAGGKFDHSASSTGCASCHGAGVSGSSFYGIPYIVALSTSSTTPGTTTHIPTTAACESCHLATLPTSAITMPTAQPALGATRFLNPAPVTGDIHRGITSNCVTCHENGKTWLGMGKYPPSSTVFTAGGVYTGFLTRPMASGGGSTTVIDPTPHPASGDCSNCHGSTDTFNVDAKPSNHIPFKTGVTCVACHTQMGPTSDFSIFPLWADIHANAPTPSTNCAQCHSAANAPTFALPGVNFTVKAPSTNHVPLKGTTACEDCHVGSGSSMASATPITNGTSTFNNSKYSHSGITTGCALCHGANVSGSSFTNIPVILALNTTATTQGASSHIPTTAACESCHVNSVPAGQMALPASVSITAGATGFKLPLTTASNAAVHSGITGSCNTCHEKNYNWLGMSLYPPSSTTTGAASYTGFLTRPYGTPSTPFAVNDAAHGSGSLLTGDCSQCHSSITAFSAAAKPAGHMPTTGTTACTVCHATPGVYGYNDSGFGSLSALHTGITATVTKLTAIPAVSSTSCVTCHTVGAGGTSGKAPFAGCATQAAVGCTSPPPLSSYQPMVVTGKVGGVGAGTATVTHVPIGTLDCTGCHASTSSFGATTMGTNGHSNATLGGDKCLSCHERGLSFNPTVNTITQRPSSHTGSKAAPNDCNNSGCHKYSSGGFRSMIKPVMRNATINPDINRLRPLSQLNLTTRGQLGNSFDHQGVEAGRCKTCHNGHNASGMPARHLMVSASCDTCHRTSAWRPAQFTHNASTSNSCMSCHNGISATARPSGHFMSARSCDACHTTALWSPVNYSHLSPAYKAAPGAATCTSCHITNSEIIPRQLRGVNRTKPTPVGP